MGVDTRKRPPLPAPTDSSTNQTSGDDNPAGTEVDLATEVSRHTDRTSYSIPEDGREIVIDTKKTTADKSRKGVTHGRNKSQTSLLIEYFEGGKDPNVSSRPSVRVKVTPSSHKKGKDTKDHIQITEASGARKPSYTRRISLGQRGSSEQIIDTGDRSVTDSSTVSGQRAAIDIEVNNKDGSDLSGTVTSSKNEEYIPINPSEVSSMPPDSMLEPMQAPSTPKRTSNRSLTQEEDLTTTGDTLKAPSRRRSRSLSRERLTKKVIEKLEQDKPRKVSGSKKHSSRSRSVSKEQLESLSSPKRLSNSSKYRKPEEIPSGEPSLLSASQASDVRSFKSGTSKSSLNNPKLLETVEDAIRRLILPELTALKQEQKTQKNREKFEKVHRDSITSAASGTKAELSRTLSKHASDPNVRSSKPKVVLNRDENDPGVLLSGDSIKKKKKSRISNDSVYDSEKSFERGMSEETVIRDSPRRRSKEHRTRDAAGAALAGGLVGGVLTSEALKHYDSKSSMASNEKRERRRKRSKSHSRSHSRSASITTDDMIAKGDIPPMPMQSEFTASDVTRDSILSERTSTPTSEARRMEIRQVARGSPRQLNSPSSNTPKKSPRAQTLDSYYKNDDRDDFSYTSEQDYSHLDTSAAAAAAGAAAGYWSNRSHEDVTYAQGRSLSPIQSEASAEERIENIQRQSAHSIDSVSRSSNADIPDHSNRPKGISLESGGEILGSHNLKSNQSLSKDPNNNSWYGNQTGHYRDSVDSFGSKVDVRHLTAYTDDSMDAPYLDKVTAAQQIRGIGNNAEFVHTPMAVESAVASLHDSSIVDGKSVQSGGSKLGEHIRADSPSAERHLEEEDYDFEKRPSRSNLGSPLKNELSLGTEVMASYGQESPAKSPRQSIAKSIDRESLPPTMSADAMPRPDDEMPAFVFDSSKSVSQGSDINTNPSIIHGPMGGSLPDNQWKTHGSPSPVKDDVAHDKIKNAAKHMLSTAAQLQKSKKSQEDQGLSKDAGVYHEDYVPGDNVYPSGKGISNPPDGDDGYVLENQRAHSRATTPDYRATGGLYGQEALNDILGNTSGDPFETPGHKRNFSGNSHGMASPLYDSATGRGIDRIQSKDIVALMDHLTVRDAERNARDTEILVTLVRSAAEMRNSFEDMKRFIEDQDNMIIDVGNKQHEKTQRVIGGPRPQPSNASRLARGSSADDVVEDIPTKKRNVFRRALKGLGGRSSNDLVKIEDMLHHLLEEVAELKANQGVSPRPATRHGTGLTSYENMRDAPQDGYEPEGHAGTSSTDNQSGYFSNHSSRQGQQSSYDRRRASENRVSTVLEGDEDAAEAPLEQHEQDVLEYENTENMLTPTREMPRGGSDPVATPPATAAPQTTGVQSNENTPHTDKSKKGHKSSSSSFFPRFSRWSKTTASSVTEGVRNSTNSRKERPSSEVSRSGSDLPNYDVADTYDPHGEDRMRSNTSLANDSARPPSPLVPSAVSDNKYQYRAHRDSINLQHPQPRAGPTARYQNHLESQVLATQAFSSPVSPTSDQFGSNPEFARFGGGAGNRHSGGTGPPLSPISDTAESMRNKGPPRPPKIPDTGPLIPDKSSLSPAQGAQTTPQHSVPRKPTFAERSGNAVQFSEPNGQMSSPGDSGRSFSGMTSPPTRKPTGPRPQVGSGSWSQEKLNPPQIQGAGQVSPGGTGVQRTRYRGSPNAIPDYDSGEDETF